METFVQADQYNAETAIKSTLSQFIGLTYLYQNFLFWIFLSIVIEANVCASMKRFLNCFYDYAML